MNIWTKKIWPWMKRELECAPPTSLEIFDRFVNEEAVMMESNEEARVEKIFRMDYKDDGIGGRIRSETVLEAMDKHFHCRFKVTELPVGLFNQDHRKRFDYGTKSVNDIVKSDSSGGRLEMELGVERLKREKLEAELAKKVSEPTFICNGTDEPKRWDKPKVIAKIKPLCWSGMVFNIKCEGIFQFLKKLKEKQDEIIRILRGEEE